MEFIFRKYSSILLIYIGLVMGSFALISGAMAIWNSQLINKKLHNIAHVQNAPTLSWYVAAEKH